MLLVAKDQGFVYFQDSFVRGLTIAGAMDSTGFVSNLYQVSQKGALVEGKNCNLFWCRILLIYEFVEKEKKIDLL